MNLKGASDDGKVSYNFNVGHLDDEGFTPGNELRRTSLSLEDVFKCLTSLALTEH